ncbi:hypothetical protein FRB99_003847, partial [Tulasnella sp. 403]
MTHIPSPLTIRTQLASALKDNGLPYWRNLTDFLQGNIGRVEFEEHVRLWINTPELLHLHNTLVYSIISRATQPQSPTSPSTIPNPNGGPPRKKRKLLPYQDPSPALNRWVLGMGKAERARVRGVLAARRAGGGAAKPPFYEGSQYERPIKTVPEGTSRAGTHVALPLSTLTRTLPTIQQLSGRMDLIAAQHQMTASKAAASLLSAAVEAYLKHITVHTLASTSSSHPFASISPSDASPQPSLAPSSFTTLFTIAPFEIPNPNPVVMNLTVTGQEKSEPEEGEEVLRRLDVKLDPVNRQIVRVLFAKSGVREMVLAHKPGRMKAIRNL